MRRRSFPAAKAAAISCGLILEEGLLPVRESVRGVCEILGFDPLYPVNEGKAVLLVAGGAAGVRMRTVSGGVRAVGYPVGNQLPRIC